MTDTTVTDVPVPADEEISFLDLLIVIARHKLLILGLPFAVAVIAAGYALTLPDIFTANTRVLQPQVQQAGASAMLAQLGGIAGLVGGAAGIKNPNDVYIAMLRSRTVAANLTQRFQLSKTWGMDPKVSSAIYDELEKITKISSGKDGIISIAVEHKDPKFAANLANAYVDELVKFTSVLAVTESSQRRLFFEKQFTLAKENLSKAEAVARQALLTGGLVKVDDQGRAMVEATARLRGQISVKEVQIGAMRSFASEMNPDLQFAQRELESMRRELAKMEGSGGPLSPSAGPNAQGADNLRLLRDVKYREVVFELLARQYELAKIDEAKDSSIIQVMDPAVEPDRKSGPKKKQIVLISAFVAFLVAIFWVIVREVSTRSFADPRQTSRLQELKRSLAWK